jgi:hypothetical protein
LICSDTIFVVRDDINLFWQSFSFVLACETWVPLGPHRPGSRPSPTRVRPTRRPADLSVSPTDLVSGPHDLLKTFQKIVTPQVLINPNSRSNQLIVVKSRSTWALTSKNSLTYSSDPLWLVNTLVGPTHGQRLGQTPLTPSVHRCLLELLPRSPKFT